LHEKTHFKVKEYAELMNISTSSVYRQIKEKKLTTETISNTKYIILKNENDTNREIENSLIKFENQKEIETELIFTEKNKKELQELEDIRDREIKFLRKQVATLEKENQRILEICNENFKTLNRENNKLRSDLTSITNRILTVFEKSDNLLKDIEFIDQTKTDEDKIKNGIIELEKYLIMNGFDLNKRSKIIEKFNKLKNEDERIIYKNSKFFINLNKYNYSDIFNK